MSDESEPRYRAEAGALANAIADLARTVTAIDLASRRNDEDAVLNAIALAGPDLGWPAEPTLLISDLGVADSLHEVWKQVGELARAVESFAQQTAPVWASQGELASAGEVQRQLMPPRELELPGARVHAFWQPAGACGGDWWVGHSLDTNRGLVVLGDVTGHGAPSALIAAVVRGACDLARMGMRSKLQPSQLLRMLNRVLIEATGQDFMSTSIGLSTERNGTVVYLANAGHRAPLLLERGRWRLVQSDREPPLGSQPAVTYAQLAVPVSPGDRLVLFTDGLTEAENEAGEQLGEKAVRLACEQCARDETGAPLRDRLQQLVTEHNRPMAPRDDVTVLVIDIG